MLAPDDIAVIEARIRALEQHTGTQVVVALVERSDRFHGLRWRAFALGAALAALAVVLASALRPDWTRPGAAIMASAVIMTGGLCAALLATCWPAFSRLFLQYSRAHAAVNQRAQSLFLERQLFATPGRNAVLLLAGCFERTLAIIGDNAYRGRVDDADWQRVVDTATVTMSGGNLRTAVIAGLDALEAMLVAQGFVAHGTPRNELGDAPIELDDRH